MNPMIVWIETLTLGMAAVLLWLGGKVLIACSLERNVCLQRVPRAIRRRGPQHGPDDPAQEVDRKYWGWRTQ